MLRIVGWHINAIRNTNDINNAMHNTKPFTTRMRVTISLLEEGGRMSLILLAMAI